MIRISILTSLIALTLVLGCGTSDTSSATGPDNYPRVDNDVWRYALPTAP